MKRYKVSYTLKSSYSTIVVKAESKEEAMEEIERVFEGGKPKHDENAWIDEETLRNCEWNIEVKKVEEIKWS